MQILKQTDPRWAKLHLGASNLTIGGEGCLTTVAAMINNHFFAIMNPVHPPCTPADVAAHKEFYNSAGLVLWDKMIMQGAVTQSNPRSYGFDSKRILDAINDPDHQQVALEVFYQHGKPGKHWLRASGLQNGRIMADDPLHGDSCDIVARYGTITGAGFFRKK